jgi:hypothetical protein
MSFKNQSTLLSPAIGTKNNRKHSSNISGVIQLNATNSPALPSGNKLSINLEIQENRADKAFRRNS